MTSTLLVLRQRLQSAIGDGVREAVTTALTTSTALTSTNLNKWDGTANDKFNDWFAYVEDYDNAGASRVIADYVTSGGVCTVRKAWGYADGAAEYATVMFTHLNPDNYLRGIQNAVRKLDGILHKNLDDTTLISGNILPNAHFDDQATSGTPDFCSFSATASGTETTTAGLIRGGKKSIKVAVTAADKYMYFDSNTYPRLLDLMGQTVTFKCWAYPSTANDAFLDIITTVAAGTTTTQSSTTTCPANNFTLLKIEDYAVPDDIVRIQFCFRVHTSGQNAYFDNSRVTGLDIHEYLLPTDFQTGVLKKVYIQTSGYADDPCDDLHINTQEFIYNCLPPIDVDINGTLYKFLRLPSSYSSKYKLRLIGYKALESLTDDGDTLSVNNPQLELVIAESALELYRIQQGLVSASDRSAYKNEIAFWEHGVAKLESIYRTSTPAGTIKFRE